MDKTIEEQLEELIDEYVDKFDYNPNSYNIYREELRQFGIEYYNIMERFEEDDNS